MPPDQRFYSNEQILSIFGLSKVGIPAVYWDREVNMSKATVEGERVVNVFFFFFNNKSWYYFDIIAPYFFVCFVSAYFTVNFCIVQLGLKWKLKSILVFLQGPMLTWLLLILKQRWSLNVPLITFYI